MWYRKAADQGDAKAQCNLGLMYNNGQGVPKSYKKPLVWYRKAADQKHAKAQFNLGAMYENGQGAPKSIAGALSWYRMAAAQEDPDAQKRLAELEAIHSPAKMASKQCANCGALEALGGAVLKPCLRYKAAVYCGKECQTKHWRLPGGHKSACFGLSD